MLVNVGIGNVLSQILNGKEGSLKSRTKLLRNNKTGAVGCGQIRGAISKICHSQEVSTENRPRGFGMAAAKNPEE